MEENATRSQGLGRKMGECRMKFSFGIRVNQEEPQEMQGRGFEQCENSSETKGKEGFGVQASGCS